MSLFSMLFSKSKKKPEKKKALYHYKYSFLPNGQKHNIQDRMYAFDSSEVKRAIAAAYPDGFAYFEILSKTKQI